MCLITLSRPLSRLHLSWIPDCMHQCSTDSFYVLLKSVERELDVPNEGVRLRALLRSFHPNGWQSFCFLIDVGVSSGVWAMRTNSSILEMTRLCTTGIQSSFASDEDIFVLPLKLRLMGGCFTLRRRLLCRNSKSEVWRPCVSLACGALSYQLLRQSI